MEGINTPYQQHIVLGSLHIILAITHSSGYLEEFIVTRDVVLKGYPFYILRTISRKVEKSLELIDSFWSNCIWLGLYSRDIVLNVPYSISAIENRYLDLDIIEVHHMKHISLCFFSYNSQFLDILSLKS